MSSCRVDLRTPAIAWLLAALAGPALWADSPAVTRVSATFRDAVFLVDGQAFSGAAAFTWPAGSKHTLEISDVEIGAGDSKTRYTFVHWSTPAGVVGGGSQIITTTADPGVPWYNADQQVEHALSIIYYQCAAAPCNPPGYVRVNQVAYSQDTDVWLADGGTVLLEATPSPGYVFAGWYQNPALPPIYSLTINGPTAVYPHFAPARAMHLATVPDGLQVLADRAPVTTQIDLEWGWDTTHTLGVVSPQQDRNGRFWVFRSWSDGGAVTHNYVMGPGVPPASLTATFVPAVGVGFLTDPTGLNVTVDGVTAAAPVYQAWGPGETHTVAAPARQTDAQGAPWTFKAWSNGAAATQTIATTDQDVDKGIRLIATYDPLSRIRVESVPTGLTVTVDGAPCRTPCELERAVGAQVKIAPPASVVVADGTRLDLVSWDGPADTFAAAAGYRKLTARYSYSYRLMLTSQPADSCRWKLDPATADGYFPAGTMVTVGVDPAAGMKFRAWHGDLSGVVNPTAIWMDAPHAVRAIFDRVAETPEPRVLNAAGETPVAAVAAGSLASLFGDRLADSTEIADSDPLPQTLGGLTLQCAGRFLPLLYVSTGQVNFEVPSDLATGAQKLELLHAGSPTVEVTFTVVRNAAGILSVAHADGSPVTPDSPGSPGERVLIYATGLGPFSPSLPDGFHVSAAPVFNVADAVEVLFGDRTLAVDSAAAATGSPPGVALVQFRIPADAASGENTVAVRTGGAISNQAKLNVR
jgi:uncharacterized protein (TIGR03437 family)